MRLAISRCTGVIMVTGSLALASCATYRPVVDMRHVTDEAKYEQDLAACQTYAQQVDPGLNAAIGAVAGALLGAAIGLITDDPWTGAYAAAGAVGGIAGGASAGIKDQKDVIRRCMSNRGYEVLN